MAERTSAWSGSCGPAGAPGGFCFTRRLHRALSSSAYLVAFFMCGSVRFPAGRGFYPHFLQVTTAGLIPPPAVFGFRRGCLRPLLRRPCSGPFRRFHGTLYRSTREPPFPSSTARRREIAETAPGGC